MRPPKKHVGLRKQPLVESECTAPTRAAIDVARERDRQITKEGWSAEHDDAHSCGEMAAAAACYALHAAGERQDVTEAGDTFIPTYWPWSPEWWKPKDKRRDLVRAAALLIAEIERLDRIEKAEAA